MKYINDDTKRAIARVAVQFVEQVWHTLHGADKLAKALETAEALLKKNIVCSSLNYSANLFLLFLRHDPRIQNGFRPS